MQRWVNDPSRPPQSGSSNHRSPTDAGLTVLSSQKPKHLAEINAIVIAHHCQKWSVQIQGVLTQFNVGRRTFQAAKSSQRIDDDRQTTIPNVVFFGQYHDNLVKLLTNNFQRSFQLKNLRENLQSYLIKANGQSLTR